MSLQDDHFDLVAYFDEQVELAKDGTPAKERAVAMRDAYVRVWDEFLEAEAEVEKLRPVANAATTIVRYVFETHFSVPHEDG